MNTNHDNDINKTLFRPLDQLYKCFNKRTLTLKDTVIFSNITVTPTIP